MSWSGVVEASLGQLGAFVAFFAFPVLQYLLLKRVARGEGQPELWYLPRYGFRLVIRNLPRRRTLSNIRYRALLRTVIPSSDGASVATLQDETLSDREDFFLFPGVDQVLLCFRLEMDRARNTIFIHTDKVGRETKRFEITDEAMVVADFTGTIENLFNFDIAVARRVEITGSRLNELAQVISSGAEEQEFEVSRVREIG
jgi:hypothetical protein